MNRGELIDFYEKMLSYGVIHGAKLPSLPEFLDLTLKEKPINKDSSFDSVSDKQMEDLALKRMEERRAALGK